jgi:arsenate reductase-like glutaredoxin family protein
MDKLGEFKNQLYHFMKNISKEKPSNEKLDRMLKLMGQMEDVLYEIKKPTSAELQKDTGKIIERLRRAENKG